MYKPNGNVFVRKYKKYIESPEYNYIINDTAEDNNHDDGNAWLVTFVNKIYDELKKKRCQ